MASKLISEVLTHDLGRYRVCQEVRRLDATPLNPSRRLVYYNVYDRERVEPLPGLLWSFSSSRLERALEWVGDQQ